LPREVGLHPEDGKKISANFGRFGPYVAHDGIYASLPSPEDVFEIGLNHAVHFAGREKGQGSRPPRRADIERSWRGTGWQADQGF
jgi:DNA topoisomerase-1